MGEVLGASKQQLLTLLLGTSLEPSGWLRSRATYPSEACLRKYSAGPSTTKGPYCNEPSFFEYGLVSIVMSS